MVGACDRYDAGERVRNRPRVKLNWRKTTLSRTRSCWRFSVGRWELIRVPGRFVEFYTLGEGANGTHGWFFEWFARSVTLTIGRRSAVFSCVAFRMCPML